MDIFIELLKPILPTILLLVGGKWILIKYELEKKKREQSIELLKAVREQQYQAVTELYTSFSELMRIHRSMKTSNSYPNDEEEYKELLSSSIQVEAKIDALILKISCEFVSESNPTLEHLLGHMRQAVQLWRETIKNKKQLPFNDSHQDDYTKFKETFSAVAAYMVHRIHTGLDAPQIRLSEARNVVMNVFSNKYELEKYKSIQGREDWIRQLTETQS
jgi:hypothetical protein